MPTDMFERITEIIIDELNIEVEIVALDGSGFSQNTANQYYMRITDIKAKKYTKCHISIDVGSRIEFYTHKH